MATPIAQVGSQIQAATVRAYQGSSVQLLARVVGFTGVALLQAGVTSVGVSVFDLDSATPTTAVTTASPSVASTIYDTLQTSANWTADATGYNFAYVVGPTVLANPQHRYHIEVKLTIGSPSGAVIMLVFPLFVERVFG